MRTIGILLAGLLSAFLISCQPIAIDEKIKTTATSPTPAVLQEHGILYVKSEHHQAQMGLSIALGGGEFRALTTSYEWWVNVDNLQQVRRVTTEWLEDGPYIIAADGSNGRNEWWQVDLAQNIPQVVYNEGQTPFALPNLETFLGVFSRSGQRLLEAVAEQEAESIEQSQQLPWGDVISIRKTDAQTGQTITAMVRIDPPHILIERVVVDQNGDLFETLRITNWTWFDPASFDSDFWMNPPQEIPVGAGHP
jgi:hypothetical protein